MGLIILYMLVIADVMLVIGVVMSLGVVLASYITWNWKIVVLATIIGLVVKAAPFVLSDLIFGVVFYLFSVSPL